MMSDNNEKFIRLIAPLATMGINKTPAPKTTALHDFIDRCHALEKPRVLELGTKRSIADRSTKHVDWVPNQASF